MAMVNSRNLIEKFLVSYRVLCWDHFSFRIRNLGCLNGVPADQSLFRTCFLRNTLGCERFQTSDGMRECCFDALVSAT